MSNNFNPGFTSQTMDNYLPTRSKVVRLLIQPIKGYNDIYVRPFEMRANHAAVNELITRTSDAIIGASGSYGIVDSSNTYSRVSNSISGIASSIMMPSGSVESLAAIDGGWMQERCRFIMTVDHERVAGGMTRSEIYGYTDVPGVSNLTGFKYSVDENMVFTINSIIEVGRQRINNAGGSYDRSFCINHKSVITDDNVFSTGLQKSVITPGSTMHRININDMQSADQSGGAIFEDASSSLVNGIHKYVNKTDALANDFLSRSMVSFVAATNEDGYDSFAAANYANAAEKINSEMNLKDHFVRALENAANGCNGVKFTLRDLKKFDYDCMNVIVVAPANQNDYMGSLSASWSTSDIKTTLAYNVSQVVPTIMVKNNLTKLEFMISNETITGQSEVLISLQRSIFNNNDHDALINTRVSDQLKAQLHMQLSAGNSMAYMLKVSCDITGDCRISLRLDQNPVTDWVCPVFADSTFSINTTTNSQRLSGIADSTQYIINEVHEAVSSGVNSKNKQFYNTNFNNISGGF